MHQPIGSHEWDAVEASYLATVLDEARAKETLKEIFHFVMEQRLQLMTHVAHIYQRIKEKADHIADIENSFSNLEGEEEEESSSASDNVDEETVVVVQ